MSKKTIIDIEEMVNDFVNTLNKQTKKANLPKIYSVDIRKGTTPLDNRKGQILKGGSEYLKNYSELRFILDNTDTHERLVLFHKEVIFTNPAQQLTLAYKKILYREFMYNAFGVFAINIEHSIRERESRALIDAATLKAEEPMTPAEAYDVEKQKHDI